VIGGFPNAAVRGILITLVLGSCILQAALLTPTCPLTTNRSSPWATSSTIGFKLVFPFPNSFIAYCAHWQSPRFSSSEEREDDPRPRSVQVLAGRSTRLSTSPHGGQGHSIDPMTTQTNTPQEASGGHSFHATLYTNQGNHINEFSYPTASQRESFQTTPQQIPPVGHHTHLSSSHHIPCDSLSSTGNTEALYHRFPGQPEGNTQVQCHPASHSVWTRR